MATVEPQNNEHVGMDHFVHYREVVRLWRGNTLSLCGLVHRKGSFIQRSHLFRVSFIGGSTVYIVLSKHTRQVQKETAHGQCALGVMGGPGKTTTQ